MYRIVRFVEGLYECKVCNEIFFLGGVDFCIFRSEERKFLFKFLINFIGNKWWELIKILVRGRLVFGSYIIKCVCLLFFYFDDCLFFFLLF